MPSFSASSRSPGGSRSPSISSIQLLASFAACGVYLPMRNLFMSWSSDVTDAMVERLGARRAYAGLCVRLGTAGRVDAMWLCK
jgi:hypothetical protein